MSNDIAIIGMAGRFPDANTTIELFDNLKSGKDSVREISKGRIKSTTLPTNRDYMLGGYLENIDMFDHKLFNIPLSEAQTMSPIHRLLLEVTYETMENSGYAKSSLYGTNTSVYVAEAITDYFLHADEYNPTLVTGNAKEYLANRIARYFNLTGTALMVDTACSSSLMALHLACNELLLGNSDYAFVCSSSLNLFPYKGEGVGLDIYSPDGKSRSFSAEANGLSRGEAVVSILLKKYDKAIQDNDNIHAVIKATATNNNANWSASPSAPNSISIAEVITKAWEKAEMSPEDIGFIEAHGSGTKLGDSLEIEGLNIAFKKYTDEKRICPISSIKPNIGHSMSSGLTSLVKTILSLKQKVLFPSINFKTPSELIDFENGAVYVNDGFRHWKVEEGKKRLAGVTSMGVSGSNCHVVLEEAPKRYSSKVSDEEQVIITISSNTSMGLKSSVGKLLDFLSCEDNLCVQDIGYTLCVGRTHYPYRYSFVTNNIEDMKEKLREYCNKFTDKVDARKSKLIYIFCDHDYELIRQLGEKLSNYSYFTRYYNECLKHVPFTESVNSFAIQYSIYQMLSEIGVNSNHILGVGLGKWVSKVVTEEITLNEALKIVTNYKAEPIQQLEERVERLIERETQNNKAVFMTLGPKNSFTYVLRSKKVTQSSFEAIDWSENDNKSHLLNEIINILYQNNVDINWIKFYNYRSGKKIELPTYSFEPIRCWIREEPKQTINPLNTELLKNKQKINQTEQVHEMNVVEKYVAEVCKKIYKTTNFSMDESFIKIGANKKSAIATVKYLNGDLSMNLVLDEVIKYPTVRSLSKYISSKMSTEQKVTIFWKSVLKIEHINLTDNFYELGGHSLLANELISLIDEEYNLDLEFNDIINHPTIESLSKFINEQLYKEEISIQEEVTQTIEHKLKNKVLSVKPFNHLYYKSCFYNSFFPVVNYFNRSILAFLINEIAVYNTKDYQIKTTYISCQDPNLFLEKQGIGTIVKNGKIDVVNELILSITNNRPVVLWIDSFFQSIREDTYQKKHIEHTLLVHGFDIEDQVFYILEHSHRDSLEYKNMKLSFQDMVNAYEGYLEYFWKDEPTYFEFYNLKETVNISRRSLIEEYFLNHHSKKVEIMAGLDNLRIFALEFKNIVRDQSQLKIYAEQLIEGMTQVINTKRIELYKQEQIFLNNSEEVGLIKEIINQWNFLRTIISKFIYSGQLKEVQIQKCLNTIDFINKLEKNSYGYLKVNF